MSNDRSLPGPVRIISPEMKSLYLSDEMVSDFHSPAALFDIPGDVY